MIPFEELVLALERYKNRKQAQAAAGGVPAAPAGKGVSGKQGQAQAGYRQVEELDELHE